MDINLFIVAENISVLDAIKAIDQTSKGIVFVAKNKKLIAAVSDGDIRRYILKNGDLTDNIEKAYNPNPKYIFDHEKVNKDDLIKMGIDALPVVNKNMEILSIVFDNNRIVSHYGKIDAPVVIMAGGKGTRLFPYTKVLPKPLVPIGDLTITEHIMTRFAKYGCTDFNMIVNHMKGMIKAYYNENQDVFTVNFFDEETPLGTGGGLKMLEGRIDKTFFMSNCDIIVESDYSAMYNFHKEQKNIVTMVCAIKNVVIPYGTVEIDEDGKITGLKEKPQMSFLTNTGFYIVEPKFFDYIEKDTFVHITDVINKCMESGENVGVYPVSENSWYDMGQIEEMERMQKALNVN